MATPSQWSSPPLVLPQALSVSWTDYTSITVSPYMCVSFHPIVYTYWVDYIVSSVDLCSEDAYTRG